MDDLRVNFRHWVQNLPEGRAKHFYQRLSVRLLLAFGLFSLAIIAFAKLANEVRDQDTLGIDRAVLLHIHSLLGSKMLDTIMPVATDIGGTVGVLVLSFLFIGACIRKRKFNRALFILTALSGTVVLNLALKSMFSRVRPELWDRFIIENGFSFPSGHSMASSALALSIVIALWYTRWRIPAIVLGVLYTGFVGFSRLYLGVHYPTDVFGGWMISFAWVALVYMVFSSVKLKPHKTQK